MKIILLTATLFNKGAQIAANSTANNNNNIRKGGAKSAKKNTVTGM
ncbi:MAG: hypothetical protein GXO77_13560 [Calditrichaeota bacterium]|nr:hypothetical protein [Calditrichota bacterium]